jgi:hypothetical protein
MRIATGQPGVPEVAEGSEDNRLKALIDVYQLQ